MNAAAAPGDARHLAPLDGLRGVAIGLVLWFHVWQISWLRADVHVFETTLNFNAIPEVGFVGVDLFFFISGFCLFYPYARALCDGRPRPTLATFAYRRALKILPSYYLSLVLVIALGRTHFASLSDGIVQVLSHVAFVHNLDAATFGGINGVLWSLAIEVQFYVVFPVVAWCAMRRPGVTCGILFASGAAYRIVVAAHTDAVHQLDQLPGTIDLFAAGIFTAYAYHALAKSRPGLIARRSAWTAFALAGVIAIAWTLASAYAARLAPGWPGVWIVWGRSALSVAFAVTTLGSLFAVPAWQRALANPVLTFLSAISYNLYLWHQQIARALLDAHLPPWRGVDEHTDATWGLAYTALAFASAIAVAWLLTAIVEWPFLRARPFEAILTRRGAPLRPDRV